MVPSTDPKARAMKSSSSSNNMPDLREYAHQLIVLGNGFDLASGLPSKYGDFFKDVPQRVFPNPGGIVGDSWGGHLRKQELTAWDVILCDADRNSNWYDVEGEIKRWVAVHPKDSADRVDKVSGLLSGHKPMGMPHLPTNWREYTGDPLTKYPEVNVARFIIDTTPDWTNKSWDRRAVLDFLLDELHRLEARFMSYLSRVMDEQEDYPMRATDILCALEESHSPAERYHHEVTVLSFNYTMPYEEDGRDLPFRTDMVNIHGRLDDGSAIFGIDGTDSLDDPDALPFTKTYRVMSADTHDVTDIAFSPTSVYGRATCPRA